MMTKQFWIVLEIGAIALWGLSLAAGHLLFPGSQLKAWGFFIGLVILHAAELPTTLRLGREKGLNQGRVILKTLLFGFTWWVPLKKEIFKA